MCIFFGNFFSSYDFACLEEIAFFEVQIILLAVFLDLLILLHICTQFMFFFVRKQAHCFDVFATFEIVLALVVKRLFILSYL